MIFLYTLLILILPLVIVVVDKCLKLYWWIRYYKKQGLKLDLFYPLLGFFHFQNEGMKYHYDPTYFFNQERIKDPSKRIVMTNLYWQPVLILSESQLIKELLVLKYDHFKKAGQFFPLVEVLITDGLVFSEGEKWKYQRKIISQAFHFGFLFKAVPYITEITKENFQNIENLDNVGLLVEMQKITGDVITRMFYGKNFSQLKIDGEAITSALAKRLNDVFWIQKRVGFKYLGSLYQKYFLNEKEKVAIRRLHEFKEFASRVIDERRENLKGTYEKNPDRKDLLQLLLESEQKDNKLTQKELVGNFITFFFAGMDTTAHLSTAVLWFIKMQPEYIQKIDQEIQQQIKQDSDINQETIQNMSFLDACVREALRLIPPTQGLFIRECIKDVELDNIKINKGTIVTYNILGATIGRGLIKEHEFYPERWLNGDIDQIDGFYKIPFSAGPRNCIGQHLSILETKIITIMFLRTFDYEIIEPHILKRTLRPLVCFHVPVRLKLTRKNTK